MDTLQKQIGTLTTKVDALYQLVDQLSNKVTEVWSECKQRPDSIHPSDAGMIARYRSQHSGLDAAMEHKDVLIDAGGLDSPLQSNEKPLSPEIQVQRLTAQLTAAYSRIAALEEQLFSQRVH
ncbi:hypothetical protein ACN4EK_21900 [Pantanalinema rosaneae CENA516]|uniref:hypothetical protein n=1 Tax=Pantanalinema rosaneae TaxID=1620701 RepID=UPI003D6E0129